ncbi:beta-lactamase [Novosphingobium nitrogenifigens DSM 19370]|uniref:Beta-lactamase n=1 Tax=Novosphingobium nitrogenifigens DSM 19370 TaxID=983920 RepID=F1Z9X3_9SPHN|nr:serine hydrolase domain-containing protein [Novosphingobium nitrogenifigens]EGD58619.1 beta-lactamase [Novosphingobium nitrogenifigens DSM 19370]
MPISALLLAAALTTPAGVAVRFDRHHAETVVQEGAADRASGRPATAVSPVRIASISKLVVALGVMRLVDGGRLDLDRDVSDYLGWPLRNPAFPDTPITLRLLLSHRSSLTDDAGYVIPLGESLRTRVADPRAWDKAHAPGSNWFHYTNLNFPVVATVMEKATGVRFDLLMQRLVLRPLHLQACYNWSPCTVQDAARAVVLYRANGEIAKDDLHGTLPTCPVEVVPGGSCDLAAYRPGENGALFSPQGGLRISMADLARIGEVLARGGHGFISPHAFAEMVRPYWRFDGTNGLGENGEGDGFFCAYGLAVQTIGLGGKGCHDDLFGDGKVRIGHPGDAYGLKSGLWVDPARGQGLAFFTTAVDDDAPKGHSAFTAREEAMVARALPQPYPRP